MIARMDRESPRSMLESDILSTYAHISVTMDHTSFKMLLHCVALAGGLWNKVFPSRNFHSHATHPRFNSHIARQCLLLHPS